MYANGLKTPAALLAALLATQAAARTDLSGCVSSKTIAYGGASLIWYVPDTGEICEFLDCGGGRAPPKTTVPGCGGYEGTATYSPSFLPGFGASATPTSTENSAPASTSASASASASGESSAGEYFSTGSGSAANSASVSGKATDVTSVATITPAPTATAETSTGVASESGSSASTGSSQGAESASASSTSTVSEAGAVPTAAVKGAMGVAVGLVAGIAML